MSPKPSTHFDGDESLSGLWNVPGNVDVGTRGHLDGVDLGTTTTNDSTHQRVGDCQLNSPGDKTKTKTIT